jgi:hypothetical protein
MNKRDEQYNELKNVHSGKHLYYNVTNTFKINLFLILFGIIFKFKSSICIIYQSRIVVHRECNIYNKNKTFKQ